MITQFIGTVAVAVIFIVGVIQIARLFDCGTEVAKFFQPRIIARFIQFLKGTFQNVL